LKYDFGVLIQLGDALALLNFGNPVSRATNASVTASCPRLLAMGKRKADNFIASDDDVDDDQDFDKSVRSSSSEEETKPKPRNVHLNRSIYSLVPFVLTPYTEKQSSGQK
jgi:hypothetical protein